MKNRVRELRTAAGLTQQQLAEQVRVSSRTIISLEKGSTTPLLLAYRIAVLFGVTVEKLYCLEENLRLEEENMKIYHKKIFGRHPVDRSGAAPPGDHAPEAELPPEIGPDMYRSPAAGPGPSVPQPVQAVRPADRLEELDERNLLIQLRSKGLAFTIVQNALLVLCLLSAAGGAALRQPGGPAGIRRDAGPVRAALVPIILGGTALRDPL